MMLDNASSAHQGPALLSMIFVYGLVHAPLLWMLVVAALRVLSNLRLWGAARRTQRQQRSELAPGQVVVAGKVRLLQGKDAAVRVEIDQHGEEHRGSKGG